MKLVKVIPESFQDYHDHISIVLFCFGCNYHCNYCYNYDYISDSNAIIEESLDSILARYVSPLTDGLVLIGGEPTIYGRVLFEISKFAKGTYGLDVKLFTNGSNPRLIVEGLLCGYFDHVSIDFKSFSDRKLIDFNFDVTGITFDSYRRDLVELFRVINWFNLSDRVEVRTTKVDALPDSEIELIKSICQSFNLKYIVQQDVSESYQRLGILKTGGEIVNH